MLEAIVPIVTADGDRSGRCARFADELGESRTTRIKRAAADVGIALNRLFAAGEDLHRPFADTGNRYGDRCLSRVRVHGCLEFREDDSRSWSESDCAHIRGREDQGQAGARTGLPFELRRLAGAAQCDFGMNPLVTFIARCNAQRSGPGLIGKP